jgi:hypothetical protein
MNFVYCWHRPGRMVGNVRTCRHCGVAIEECPCVEYRVVKGGATCACEGSGWVAIVRSKVMLIAGLLGIEAPYMEREDRWE